MLVDFMVTNTKLGIKICIEVKFDSIETNNGVGKIITIICVTYEQKDFLNVDFN